jgi:biuret amidohydrolase
MTNDQLTVLADPGPFRFESAHTALVVIDMQRDFVEPGGSAKRWATTSVCCGR